MNSIDVLSRSIARIKPVLMSLLLSMSLVGCDAQPTLVFEDAWVRSAPPGAGMMAAYGRLRNGTDTELVLTGFNSPAYRGVSLHRTIRSDGVNTMQAVAELKIPAKGSVSLQPGELHLMLHHPMGDVQTGDSLRFEITEAGGQQHVFHLLVEKR
jgi:copper(I)-binding protein